MSKDLGEKKEGLATWEYVLTLTVLVATIDAQWEGMGDVRSARYEPALRPPCLTISVLSYSNCERSTHSMSGTSSSFIIAKYLHYVRSTLCVCACVCTV